MVAYAMLYLLLLIAGCTGTPGAGPGHDTWTDTAFPPYVDTGPDTAVDSPPDTPYDDCDLGTPTGPPLADELAAVRARSWATMTCDVAVNRCADAGGQAFVCLGQSWFGEGTRRDCYRESDGQIVFTEIASDVPQYCGSTSYSISGGENPACVTYLELGDLDPCPPACGNEITYAGVPAAPVCADGPRGSAYVLPEVFYGAPPPLCTPLVWEPGAPEACVAVLDGRLVQVAPDGGVTPFGPAVVPWSAALDVDGDGLLDLASPGASGVTLLRGAYGPAPVTESWVTGAVLTVSAAGDLDGDGRLDLTFVSGDGRTRLLLASTPIGTAYRSLALVSGAPFGDLDGDGVDELSVDNGYTTTVTSQPWLPSPPTWTGASRLRRAGDVDGDGIADLMSDAGVSFGPVTGFDLRLLPGRPALAAADVDGDGQTDLILGDPGEEARTCATSWEQPLTRPTMTLSWIRGPVARAPAPDEVALGSVVVPGEPDEFTDVRAERGGLVVQQYGVGHGNAWWWCPPP